MPIKIPNKLPAKNTLLNENIFVMDEDRALHQDIRSAQDPHPEPDAHQDHHRNSAAAAAGKYRHPGGDRADAGENARVEKHARRAPAGFLQDLDEVEKELYDAMIITGAPVEHLPFEEVDYWVGIARRSWIGGWSMFSPCCIFAGEPRPLFTITTACPNIRCPPSNSACLNIMSTEKNSRLMRGFDDVFYAPHSRHTEVRRSDVEQSSWHEDPVRVG